MKDWAEQKGYVAALSSLDLIIIKSYTYTGGWLKNKHKILFTFAKEVNIVSIDWFVSLPVSNITQEVISRFC